MWFTPLIGIFIVMLVSLVAAAVSARLLLGLQPAVVFTGRFCASKLQVPLEHAGYEPIGSREPCPRLGMSLLRQPTAHRSQANQSCGGEGRTREEGAFRATYIPESACDYAGGKQREPGDKIEHAEGGSA
jgi:hypothetical protein